MIKALVFVTAVAAAAPALAQTFPANTVPLPTRTTCLGCVNTNPVPILPTDYVFLARPFPEAGGENGLRLESYGALPLSAFAGAADIAAVRGELGEGLSRLDDRLSMGVALASATDLQNPAPGAANRLGGLVTTYRGQTAAGFNYTRQNGRLDLGVAVGVGRGASLGKASVGISW